jgi:hypothetical protein
MNKIQDHIDLSKKIIKCKECKCLMLNKYLDNILCNKCEKQYMNIINKIL